MNRWFERSFGTHYSDLYSHRDRADARKAIEFIKASFNPDILSGPTLDLCCGPGRHMQEWRELVGTEVVGLDLSRDLLSIAQKEPEHDPLIQGDMRHLPLLPSSIKFVYNLFNSFGYFMEDAENEQVIREVARILRKDGLFLIEHMNPTFVRHHLQPMTERVTSGGANVREDRWIDDVRRRVEKRVCVVFQDGRQLEFFESVRLYEPDELIAMAEKEGLAVQKLAGDYDSSTFEPQLSPRAIYIFKRND